MKALFNCRANSFSLPAIWQGSAYLLPLANKPLIEYWLDLCVWLGIKEVLVVLYADGPEIQRHLRDGAEWGLRIQYSQGHPDDVLPDILTDQALFLSEDTLILDGLLFPFYNRREVKSLPASSSESVIYCLDRQQLRLNDTCLLFPLAALQGVISAQNDMQRFERWTSLPLDQHPSLNFPIMIPQNLSDYFLLSLKLLESHQQFYLKGFEVAPGVFEGINNEIAQRPALGGPTITGQLCKLGPEVRLQRAVLGDQVRLEGQVFLKDCLIHGPIYLADVQIERRIILPGQCLDPFTGQSLPLEMPWRLKQRLEEHSQRQALQAEDAKIAQGLLWWRWPLYQLLRWSVPHSLQKFYLNANGETLVITHFEVPEDPNPLQSLFFHLSLQRVPLLMAVREQRLLLVGTRLLPAGSEQLRYMQQLPLYAPGAFSLTEDAQLGSLAHLMEELHYCSQVDDALNEQIWLQTLEQDKLRFPLA